VSPNPIPSLPGTGGSLPANLTAPNYVLRPGRPRIASDLEALIVRFARENSGWGYNRIVGALANLGHVVSDQTVGNILRRYGIQPAPKRSQNTTWKDFIASHMAALAGTDFFTVEVLTWRGLATYYVLFFIHLESRRVSLAGLTKHPTAEWTIQMARNAADEGSGFLRGMRYLLHDRGYEILRCVSGCPNPKSQSFGTDPKLLKLCGLVRPVGLEPTAFCSGV
jgi:hypothetical protein